MPVMPFHKHTDDEMPPGLIRFPAAAADETVQQASLVSQPAIEPLEVEEIAIIARLSDPPATRGLVGVVEFALEYLGTRYRLDYKVVPEALSFNLSELEDDSSIVRDIGEGSYTQAFTLSLAGSRAFLMDTGTQAKLIATRRLDACDHKGPLTLNVDAELREGLQVQGRLVRMRRLSSLEGED